MKLLGISGSLRKDSVNTKLIHEAARHFEPSDFSIGNLRLPLYDGDLEAAEGIPAEAQIGRSEKRVGLGQPCGGKSLARQTFGGDVGGCWPYGRGAGAV